MKKFEYIKWFWEFIDTETPVLLFYEVDLTNERYATRMIEIFSDRTIHVIAEEGFAFVTETPVPTVEEINLEDEFYAEIISQNAFNKIYHSETYTGEIAFPEK